MQSIPVDTARLGVLRCAIAPEAKLTNPETQEVKRDRDGNPVWTVAVTVRQDRRRISVIEIAVSGQPKGIEEGQIVRVSRLTAFMWSMGEARRQFPRRRDHPGAGSCRAGQGR